MKYKFLENPSVNDAYKLISEGLRKKAMISMFCCCKIEYEGRALSQLGYGERNILIKPDGCFLVHSDNKVDPINWQPPSSRTRVDIKNGTLYLESYRKTPREYLEVEVKKANLVSYAIVTDYEELQMGGYEKDMGDMLMDKPYLIEEGFHPTAREYSVEHGYIDILGKDKDNNLVVVELKARKAGTNAVNQIRRYLEDFEDTNHADLEDFNIEKQNVRGILVAPSINNDAEELLEKEGIEFVSIEPPREISTDKKVTLDSFQ